AQCDDRLLLCQRRKAGVPGVVIASGERRRPKRHDGIADILVDHAMMLVDNGSNRTKVAVQQIDDSASGELLADTGATLDVRKEHCEIAALGLISAISYQPGDDTGVDKLAERFLDAFPRAQLLDHAIERKSKLADLIACADHHRLRIAAGLDLPGTDN